MKDIQRDAPAFDFYPERWLVGTASLTDAEQLSYLRLLCHQWTMDGLPDDVAVLRRIAGKGVTDAVLSKFQPDNGKLRNPRLEIIRREQRDRITKSRDKIEKMNAARRAKSPHQDPLKDPLQEDLEDPSCRLPHHPPPTTHPLEINKNLGAGDLCGADEAWAYANGNGIGITREGVDLWHATQVRNGWTISRGGVETPIRDWRAALRSSVAWIREALAKAQAAEARVKPAGQGSRFSRPEESVSTTARAPGYENDF